MLPSADSKWLGLPVTAPELPGNNTATIARVLSVARPYLHRRARFERPLNSDITVSSQSAERISWPERSNFE
jgi:hypothetical protein